MAAFDGREMHILENGGMRSATRHNSAAYSEKS